MGLGDMPAPSALLAPGEDPYVEGEGVEEENPSALDEEN